MEQMRIDRFMESFGITDAPEAIETAGNEYTMELRAILAELGQKNIDVDEAKRRLRELNNTTLEALTASPDERPAE